MSENSNENMKVDEVMNNPETTITMIGAGGAGIHIVDYIYNKISDELANIVNFNIYGIDASGSDMGIIPDTTRLSKDGIGDEPLSGSGSNIAENWMNVKPGVIKWLNEHPSIITPNDKHFVLIFAGIGGGSGGAIALRLIEQLKNRDVNCLLFFAGETKDLGSALNTKDALSLLNKLSRGVLHKPVSLYYSDNMNDGHHNKLQVNGYMAGYTKYFSILASSLNEGVDQSEMTKITNPDKFSRFTIPEGVYLTDAVSKNIAQSFRNVRAILARYIAPIDMESTVAGSADHTRQGITHPSITNIVGQTPVGVYITNIGFKPMVVDISNKISAMEHEKMSDDIEDTTGLEF